MTMASKWVSHAGMQRIKQAAKFVEQSEFKYKMTANAKEQGFQRLGKQEALLKARAAYRQELYMENVQKIASEFQRLRDVEDRRRKELDAALERSRRPCSYRGVDGVGPGAAGSALLARLLAHVAVYDQLLSADDIAVHVRMGRRGGAERGVSHSRDAARLFALAAEHFERHHNMSPTISGCASSTLSVYVII